MKSFFLVILVVMFFMATDVEGGKSKSRTASNVASKVPIALEAASDTTNVADFLIRNSGAEHISGFMLPLFLTSIMLIVRYYE